MASFLQFKNRGKPHFELLNREHFLYFGERMRNIEREQIFININSMLLGRPEDIGYHYQTTTIRIIFCEFLIPSY